MKFYKVLWISMNFYEVLLKHNLDPKLSSNCELCGEQFRYTKVHSAQWSPRTRGYGGWYYPSRDSDHKSQAWYHNSGQNQQNVSHLWTHMPTDGKYRQTTRIQNKQICSSTYRHLPPAHNSDSFWNNLHWPYLKTKSHTSPDSACTSFANRESNLETLRRTFLLWASTPATISGSAGTTRFSRSHPSFLPLSLIQSNPLCKPPIFLWRPGPGQPCPWSKSNLGKLVILVVVTGPLFIDL